MVYGLCILSSDGGISPRLFCIYLFFASKRVHYDQLRLLIVIVYNTLSPVGAYLGVKGEKSREEQGKLRGRKGIDTACNKFAPPVRISCSGRGNILRRACEYLAAAAKRLPSTELLLHGEVMIGSSELYFSKRRMLS